MNPYFYIFIRQDLSLADQLCQTNHATFEMAYTLSQSVDPLAPSIVLIGVPNQKALERVMLKLQQNHIEFSPFYEDDNDMGLTAVATVPLAEEQRAALRNYRLWNENDVVFARSSVVRASTSQEDEGRLFESGRANQNARVA